MILLIIRMKVLPEKRKELSQTIASLIGSLSLRTEKGCLRCDFYQSMEDENEFLNFLRMGYPGEPKQPNEVGAF